MNKILLILAGTVIFSLIALPGQAQNLMDTQYSAFDDPLLCEAFDFWSCDELNWTYVNITYYVSDYSGIADDWVNETGDTMTGNLNLTEGLWLNVTDCDTLDTDSEGYVYCGIDADTIYGGVDDVWVNETGDIMTGNLYIKNDGLYINATSCDTLDTDSEGFIYCGTDADTIYGGVTDDWWNETGDTGLSGNYTFTAGTRAWWSNGTLESSEAYFPTARIRNLYGFSPLYIHSQIYIRENITVNVNKTYWIGNATMWWGKIYSDIFRGITGIFDNLRTNQITHFNGDTILWPNGTLETGPDADTIYDGVADDWVNETGDTMTGDLNITDGIECFNISSDGRTNQYYYEASGQGYAEFDPRMTWTELWEVVHDDYYDSIGWDVDLRYDPSALGFLEESTWEYTWLDWSAVQVHPPVLGGAAVMEINFINAYVNSTSAGGYFLNFSNSVDGNVFVVDYEGDTYMYGNLYVDGGYVNLGTSDTVKIHDLVSTNVTSGHLQVGQQPKFRAYLSSDQDNLIDNTWTKVLLDGESYDPEGKFASYKYTPTISGYYQVNAHVMWEGPELVADKNYLAAVYRNGAVVFDTSCHASVTGRNLGCSLSDIVYLDVNDYIELYAYSNSDNNLVDINGLERHTYMSAQLLG